MVQETAGDPAPSQVLAALAEPSRLAPYLGAKVQSTSRDKRSGMLVSYIDARAAAQILDDVLADVDGSWSTAIVSGPDPAGQPDSNGIERRLGYTARVRLTIKFPGWEASREDIGYGSVTASGGNIDAAVKGAVSDAVKRAAAQFGVGRALYDLPRAWIPINDRGYPVNDADLEAVVKHWSGLLDGSVAPGTPVPGGRERQPAQAPVSAPPPPPAASGGGGQAPASPPPAAPQAAPRASAPAAAPASAPVSSGDGPTQRQRGMYNGRKRELAEVRGEEEVDAVLTHWAQATLGCELGEMDKRGMSQAINFLGAMKDDQASWEEWLRSAWPETAQPAAAVASGDDLDDIPF